MNQKHPEKISRWLAQPGGVGDPEWERRVVADATLAEEAYTSLEMEAALAEAAAEVAPPVPSVWRRVAWSTCALAAVLALVIVIPNTEAPWNRDPSGTEALRLRGQGSGASIAVLSPLGEQEAFPRQFVWQRGEVALDSQFRWELYDATAHRRAVGVVADTILTRPGMATPTDSLGEWRWLVVELKVDGSEGSTSAAGHFTVGPKDRHE